MNTTTVFEIQFKDGRLYRVFCANSSQKKRFFQTIPKIDHLISGYKSIANGIHNISQWERQVDHEVIEVTDEDLLRGLLQD